MRRALPLLILLITALAACGTRGPLTLPPPVTKPAAKPAPAASVLPSDLNTPLNTD